MNDFPACIVASAALFFADSNSMRRLRAFSGEKPWASYLPVFSAWVIIGSGIFTLLRAVFDF